MIRECSSPHNSYLRNMLHLTIAFPNVPTGYPYDQSSFYSELNILLNSLRKLSHHLWGFRIKAYVILASKFASRLASHVLLPATLLEMLPFGIRCKSYISLLWTPSTFRLRHQVDACRFETSCTSRNYLSMCRPRDTLYFIPWDSPGWLTWYWSNPLRFPLLT